jgi:hypothetical protein
MCKIHRDDWLVLTAQPALDRRSRNAERSNDVGVTHGLDEVT